MWSLLARLGLPARPPPARPPPLLQLDGGATVGWPDLAKHLIALGSTGAGKTFSIEPLVARMLADACGLLVGVKPDDPERAARMAARQGFADRLVRVRPGSGHCINPVQYLLDATDGSAEAVAEFVGRLNRAVLAQDGSGRSELYWANLFDQAVLNAIRLVACAGYTAGFDLLVRLLEDSPGSPKAAASKRLLARPVFGRLLAEARQNCPAARKDDLDRACAFFLGAFPAVGYKGRGATLSMTSGCLGRLSGGPFRDAFGEATTLTPDDLDRRGLVAVLEYPLLRYGPAARTFALAWTLLAQGYCLRRDAAAARRFVLVRDEAQYALNAETDWQAATVARSQKLVMVSIVQDLDVLIAALGAGDQARHQALAFVNNHGVKLMFHNDSAETNEYASKLGGEHREVFLGGGGGGGPPPDDPLDRALGVAVPFTWHEQVRPRLPPGALARLRTGQAVVFVSGRPVGPAGFAVHDFWRADA